MKTTPLLFVLILWILSLTFTIQVNAQTTNLIWAKNITYTYSGTYDYIYPTDMVIDNTGSYYITGYFSGILDMDPGIGTQTISSISSNSTNDIFIAKYNGSGHLVWARSLGGNSDDAGNALHLVNNMLYVVGGFRSSSMDADPGPGTYTIQGVSGVTLSGFMVKLDTSGVFQSAFSIPQTNLYTIKTDNSGNIYLGGQFMGGNVDLDPGPGTYNQSSIIYQNTYSWDLFYGKYSSSGSMLWAQTKGTYWNDIINSIDVDPLTGNILAGGTYNNGYLALATPSGSITKEATLLGSAVTDIVFNPSGDFYFSGLYKGGGDFDWSTTATYTLPIYGNYAQAYVAKYNSSNNFVWATQMAPVFTINAAYNPAINLDLNGDVLVTAGEANASSTSWLYFAKLNKVSGLPIWRNNMTASCYNGANGNVGKGIVFDPTDGSVVVVGNIGGVSSGGSVPCSFDADPGSGVYTLTCGAIATITRDLFLGKYSSCAAAPSIVSSIAGNTLVCPGSSNVYSVSPLAEANAYTWTLPNGWAGASNTNTITVTPGTTSGSIIVTATNSCGNSSVALSVNTASLPVMPAAIDGSTNSCIGSTLLYSVAAVSNVSSYNWTLPSGWTGSSTDNTISVVPGIGNTVVSVSALNSCGASAAQSLTIQINPLPTLSVSGPSVSCSTDTITLSVTGASSYTWNNLSNATSFTDSPVSSISYSVVGTDGNGCSNSAVKQVSVNPLPVISIAGTSTLCAGNTITLSASGAVSYTWNNISQSASTITLAPLTSTAIVAVGTDTNGCLANAIKSLTVNPLPAVAINGSLQICTGNSTSLTAGGANTYTWSNNTNGNFITVSPSVNTSYTLTGSDINGCKGSAAVTVTVNSLPNISFTGPGQICLGNSVSISASGATSYTWNNNTMGSSILVSPVTNTNYTVTGVNSNSCLNTATTSVIVNPLPSLTIAGPSHICAGEFANLTASGATTYTWNTLASGNTISVSPTNNISYTVSGSDLNGCQNTAVISLTVNPLPTVTISGSLQICAGNSTSLTAAGANTYTWNNNLNSNIITVNPSANTGYTLSGTDANGCNGYTSVTVTVNPLPLITIGGASSPVCSGNTVSLLAGGANTYTWNNGTLGSVNTLTLFNTTNCTVTATDMNGCNNTASASIVVAPLPTLSVSGSTLICSGDTIMLTVTGANTYTWNTNNNGATISISPSVSTTYTIHGTDLNGCANSTTAGIVVNPSPVISISTTQTLICVGETIALTASGASTYTWSNGQTTPSNIVSPLATSNYTVTGANTEGCAQSAAITLSVSECLGLNTIEHKASVKIYPNPVRNILTIEDVHSINKIIIYDMANRILYQNSNPNKETLHIDMKDFTNGLYILMLHKGNTVENIKIIKQ